MKKLLSVILALALMLTLCVSFAVADDTITLTVMSSVQTEDEAELEAAMAEAYMASHPDVKIEFISCPNNDLDARITTLAASNDLPDAIFLNNAFITTALDMGIIVDVKDYLPESFMNDLSKDVVDYATFGDTMTFVPWFQIPVALIYRADWAEQAGITSIETTDELAEAAKKFSEISGAYGFSMVGTRNGSGEGRFAVYGQCFGVDYAVENEDGSWGSDMTGDNFKAAVQSFVDLDLVHGVVPAGASETGYQDAVGYFANSQTGMIITGSNAIGAILVRNPDLAGKLGSMPCPAGTNADGRHATNLQVSGYAITTSCEHPEIMADYLASMAEYENAIVFGSATGRMPVINSALESEIFTDPQYAGFTAAMQYSIKPTTFPGYSEMADIFGEAYNTMLTGVSVDDAMATVSERIEELLEDY